VLSYDANGSTVREELGDPAFQVTEYVYDPQDRLIEVKRDGVSQVEYAYDPYGQRIWRETKPVSLEGATVTWFLYSREGLIGEYRADGTAIREYGWLPSGMWGTDPVWQHDATGTHVMHNDHLFTPERMTKAGEHVVSWAGTREAFGRVAVLRGSISTLLLWFPGLWVVGVGGFYQNWWREYGAGVGRYRSVDPIGLSGGINSMVYAMQNSVGKFDMDGKHPRTADCCEAAFRKNKHLEGSSSPRGSIGGVVCCCGEKHACAWIDHRPELATELDARWIYRICVKRHEKEHFDVVECPDGEGPFRPDAYLTESEARREECGAYVVQIKCMREEMEARRCNAECRRQLELLIDMTKSVATGEYECLSTINTL
jgi:RHS repeat-associated protein